MTKRPTIKSPCVADRHHADGERIAEFSAPNGKGGLISLRQMDDGQLVISLYRLDAGVIVHCNPIHFANDLRKL